MASDDGNTAINNDQVEWVPLTLTLVEYPKGDIIGKFLALISLAPFGIGSGFIALILFRRDLHTITFFLGTLLSELLNYILKHIICEARPIRRDIIYVEYGMPSSHAQYVWFFATYVIYFVYIRLQHMNNNTIIQSLSKFLILFSTLSMAILVSISRIYLEYHTVSQVLYGALLGFLFATFWFAFTYLVLAPLFPQIVSWSISELLLLRDTTLIPNVLWFEYTNTRKEVHARSRKLVSMKSQ
ncbi:dolichyldiphosphatase 1-like [Diorhabda carinulata]|uniref:dolichyldiphosphatase 1-like n=1 Tax=Diorhabda sublineata TaxID=1163346 RepID=UPI0024E0F7D2|nr:dolichyldiphosphatase 1-like [Diorhabda sublineata]XP_056642033.1 dolichyldiphosphatase 1-like [Diorhabda sublineata]XP_057662732.1 dolichyldiphosphatase 1-like [Diorhabda carinulata]